MSHSKPRLISVGWSMINSPGLTLFPFTAAPAPLNRKRAAGQIVNQVFVFFMPTFRDGQTNCYDRSCRLFPLGTEGKPSRWIHVRCGTCRTLRAGQSREYGLSQNHRSD